MAGALLAALGMWGCHETDQLRRLSTGGDGGVPQAEGVPPVVPDTAPEEVQQPPVLPEDLDFTPTPEENGVPGPMEGVYRDKGEAEEGALIRGLISFPIRDRKALEERLEAMYEPTSARFRQYMTREEWMDAHAPLERDVQLVADWLRTQGMQVPRIATNRLLLQFTGTVGQFNKAFGARLRVLERKSPQGGNPPHDVYGLTDEVSVPAFVAERIAAVATADLVEFGAPMPGEFGEVPDTLPGNPADGLSPQQVAHAYQLDDLWERGLRGRGVKLGVTIGAGFRYKDLRAFWQLFGIQRADPRVEVTMEPPSTRYREGTLDVQWAGAMAPEAELVVYQGPDARNTSMVYTFNEAVGRGEVSVITDSFAHREDSEPRPMEEAYDRAAMMGAALGITIVAAGGDSAGVDTPGNSPYVTSVGGTRLTMSGLTFVDEVTWLYSGSGLSRTFRTPKWQQGLEGLGGKRAVADVALNAEQGYWYTWLGVHSPNTGTSFAAPVFAGILAVINQARAEEGRPPVGHLNPLLYTDADVQASFRDITEGRTDWGYESGPGWDVPTGWGAPQAAALHRALP